MAEKYKTNVVQKSTSMWNKSLPAMNNGKNTKSEMGVDRNKINRSAGDMYKKPGKTGKGMASSRSDESSSETGPIKAGNDNAKRYGGVPQPEQFTNACGPKKTKFIW